MKQVYYIPRLFAAAALWALASCTSFDEVNSNPNSPEKIPTESIVSYTQKSILNAARSITLSISGTDLYVQWFANNTYTDTDRYYWLSNTGTTIWKEFYLAQSNLDELILLNEQESTRLQAAKNGDNNNQIAAARILKVWTYQLMTDAWGDIPYNSYHGNNPTFDAGQAEHGIIYAQYATQESIYRDLLTELKEASAQINLSAAVFIKGDAIYNGNALKWKKLANSLSLRIANRIRHKLPEAGARIQEIIDHPTEYPLFESNSDNASLAYEATAPNQAPFYSATILANRNDYAISNILIDFLAGSKAPFNQYDPRLPYYAQPNADGNYVGQPYGLDTYTASLTNPDSISKPGKALYAPDYHEVLIEYAEVQFILSEYTQWNETYYREGIRASMQKWGVPENEIATYLQMALPATAETVLTQKWVALLMQGSEAWAEYRRTGYPTFLIKKGDVIWKGILDKQEVTNIFEPIGINSIPSRLLYPNSEIQLNTEHYQQAVNRQGSDALDTKIWWNK